MEGREGLKVARGVAAQRSKFGFLWVGLAIVLSFAGCLERNNPFDPVNFQGFPGTKVGLQARIDSLKRSAIPTAEQLSTWTNLLTQKRSAFEADSIAQQIVLTENNSVLELNTSTELANAAANDFRSLKDWLPLNRLQDAMNPEPFPDFTTLRIKSEAGAKEVQTWIGLHNSNLYVDAYFTQIEIGTLDQEFQAAIVALSALEQQVLLLQSRVVQNGEYVASQNAIVDDWNRTITIVNADLNFRRQAGDRTIVATKEVLDSLVRVVQAGDTLFLDSGVFRGRLALTQNGEPGKPILIQGHPSLTTVFDAGGIEGTLFLTTQSHLIFRNLVFSGSSTSGVKLEAGTQSIEFEHCLFRNNEGVGVDGNDGSANFTDCIMIHNRGGGIRSVNQQINLTNVLVAHNGGSGIDLVTVGGSLSRVTSSDNQANALMVSSVTSGNTLNIINSIFAFSNNGFQTVGIPPTPSQIPVDNCDFYGNRAADLVVGESLATSINNIAADPEFISRDSLAGLNYRPKAASELDRLEESNRIVIGYRPK
jgi:hypothetical protein